MPAVIESSHIDSKTGNLIAWWMTKYEGAAKGEARPRVPVLVTHPYAIFIQWRDEESDPNSADRRVFIFYDNVAKKSYQTESFDAFLNVVANQPHDITLLQHETCTASRCSMPKEAWERLEKVLTDGNRTWAVNPVNDTRFQIDCYCEFEWDFVFPCDEKEER